MRRFLISVVLVATGWLAVWEAVGISQPSGLPQGLKPGVQKGPDGTAKATLLQNNFVPGLKPNLAGDEFTGLKPVASTLLARLSGTAEAMPLQGRTPETDSKEAKTPLKRPTEGLLDGAPKDTALLYTSTRQYEREAWLHGGERFPVGAQIVVREDGKSRALVAGFAATADANVSFDGAKVLFAGKREPQDSWQIWEVAVGGGEPRPITACIGDCVRPFYLPGGRLVYAHRVNGRFVLEAAALEGGTTLQLTYAPGNAIPTDVLRDGRILFEAAYPLGRGSAPEVYTVYSDGSGVEAYRCDHGPRREAGKQGTSGDIVFASEHGLGRFTSAVAHGIDLSAPAGEFAGDVVEAAAGEYLVSWRPDAKARYALQSWNPKAGLFEPLVAASDADLVQPIIVAPRHVPNQHPSGLHDWNYANLLCLNSYTSKYSFAAGTIAVMKLYTTNEAGKAKLLGSSSVEPDGSFYVQVPADKPLQMELLDRQGKTLRREQGSWWMRKGEQRICVGCHAGPERAPENAVPQVLVKSVKPVVMTGK